MSSQPSVADFRDGGRNRAATARVHEATLAMAKAKGVDYRRARDLAMAAALDREDPLPLNPITNAERQACITRIVMREGISHAEAYAKLTATKGNPAALRQLLRPTETAAAPGRLQAEAASDNCKEEGCTCTEFQGEGETCSRDGCAHVKASHDKAKASAAARSTLRAVPAAASLPAFWSKLDAALATLTTAVGPTFTAQEAAAYRIVVYEGPAPVGPARDAKDALVAALVNANEKASDIARRRVVDAVRCYRAALNENAGGSAA